MKRSYVKTFIFVAASIVIFSVAWYLRAKHGRVPSPAATDNNSAEFTARLPGAVNGADSSAPTQVSIHNLMLRKGPDFRIYIPWLRGEMVRTRKSVNPSFDDPESFVLEVKRGVIHANVGDISHFLNAGTGTQSPLKNIAISGDGTHVSLRGTVHKLLLPLPVELDGTISPSSDNRIRVHVNKLSVLKLPMKGLLGGFHIGLADLMKGPGIAGIEIAGDDIFFNTQALLPPPHIHGKLTSVRFANPDIEVVYGGAQGDPERFAQWHNFLRLGGGTLDFGKLTMHQVDLIMIDASKDAWFDLDLVNYQAQLVNGYTRVTPQAGLEIFMPDLDEVTRKRSASISAEWLKNRDLPPPPEVLIK